MPTTPRSSEHTTVASDTPPAEPILKGALVGQKLRRLLHAPQRPPSDTAGQGAMLLKPTLRRGQRANPHR